MRTPEPHRRVLSGARSRVRGIHSHRAFTLMEVIGVMAVMVLIAAVLTPNLAQRVSRTKAAEDVSELAAIGDALMDYVTRYQSIPGAKTWSSSAASVLGLSQNQVLYSIPEDTTTARVYLIHPSFRPRSGNGEFDDPIWAQDVEGATEVAYAKVMILSVHRPGLSMPVTSGAASSVQAFDNVWNWNLNPATDDPPPGWPSSWEANGEYLHIQRINFEPLFRRATFSNSQNPDKAPYFQIGSASAKALSGTPTFDSWYLVNSFIRVYADNGGSATPGALQLSQTLQDGANFLYASDRWQIP